MLSSISKFFYIIKEDKASFFGLLSMAVFASILEAIGIGLVGPFLMLILSPTRVQQNAFLNTIYKAIGAENYTYFLLFSSSVLVVIFCLKSLVYFLIKWRIINFSLNQRSKIVTRLLKGYLSLPYTFYLSRDTASIIHRIGQESQRFCFHFMIAFLKGFASLVILVTLISVLATLDFTILAMLLAGILPVIFLFYTLRNKIKDIGKKASLASYKMVRIINHSLGGIKETYVIGCQPSFVDQIDIEGKTWAKSQSAYLGLQESPRILIETFLMVFLVVFICISQVIFNQPGDALITILGTFAVAAFRIIPSAGEFTRAIGSLQNTAYTVDILYSDLKMIELSVETLKHPEKNTTASTARIKSRSLAPDAMSFVRTLSLSNLTFSYPEAKKPSIEGISLTMTKGQSIALIGKSGAGKTTLVDVFLGLLQPQAGDILVDGVSVYENLRSWQNLIGYIPQSIFLLDDTIEKNIAFGVPEDLIDQEKLNDAIEKAQLSDLIFELPDRLKTCVGERGVRLSGGQRQRIGIARALYHDREILVFDEATSALDNETEQLVTVAIQNLSAFKTVIIIAHRLTTVKHCDVVYELEQGKVMRYGSFKEVVGI